MYNFFMLEVVGCLILQVDPCTLVRNITVAAEPPLLIPEKKDGKNLVELLKIEKSRLAPTRIFSLQLRHSRFGEAI